MISLGTLALSAALLPSLSPPLMSSPLALRAQQMPDDTPTEMMPAEPLPYEITGNTLSIPLDGLLNPSEGAGYKVIVTNVAPPASSEAPGNGIYEVLGRKAGAIPAWADKEDTALAELFPDQFVVMVERQGKNLNFLRDLAEIEAYAQISKMISSDVEQRLDATRQGGGQGYSEAVTKIVGASSKAVFSGLVKESDWWELRNYHSPLSEMKGNQYFYMALYLIPKTRVEQYVREQIKKQFGTLPPVPQGQGENLDNAIKKLKGEAPAAPVAENPDPINRLLQMLKTHQSNETQSPR